MKLFTYKLFINENSSSINIPSILYHGTNVKFNEFDEKFQKNGWLGKGFYFTDNYKYAKKNGMFVIKVKLKIDKPFIVKGESPSDIITEINDLNKNYYITDNVEEILKPLGYDSIIFNHWDKGLIISCFYTNQIEVI